MSVVLSVLGTGDVGDVLGSRDFILNDETSIAGGC